ncbi:hypothetical protein PABG_11844 [Paracoccidioides brasiliensis Pb03]|nr:hypothetical protein PABG_11844 [Paracoccidioides brasiliensis Pb03]
MTIKSAYSEDGLDENCQPVLRMFAFERVTTLRISYEEYKIYCSFQSDTEKKGFNMRLVRLSVHISSPLNQIVTVTHKIVPASDLAYHRPFETRLNVLGSQRLAENVLHLWLT